jgi:excisionase family DNA binding protein
MAQVTFTLGDDALEALARRAAQIVMEEMERRDGWLRGADEIAAYIGAKRDPVYALVSAGRIPVHRDGSALVAKRSELDAWIRNGGGKRP